MMISKKGIETVQLILILAVCFIAIVFLFSFFTKGYGHTCKRAQIAELSEKVYRKLKHFKEMNETIPPGSSTTIYDFTLKPCVKKIEYGLSDTGSGEMVLKIKWSDGQEERPANGEWLMKNPNPPPEYVNLILEEEDTYVLRVSLERVELV